MYVQPERETPTKRTTFNRASRESDDKYGTICFFSIGNDRTTYEEVLISEIEIQLKFVLYGLYCGGERFPKIEYKIS